VFTQDDPLDSVNIQSAAIADACDAVVTVVKLYLTPGLLFMDVTSLYHVFAERVAVLAKRKIDITGFFWMKFAEPIDVLKIALPPGAVASA
jgi:hypothetical protein